jgi:hypothetical protein
MGEAIAAAAYMADKGTGEQDRAEARAQCADLTAKLNAVLNPPTPPVQMVPVRLFDEGDQL